MSREGQGKVKARSKQGNYNLMGLDTIEITLLKTYYEEFQETHLSVKFKEKPVESLVNTMVREEDNTAVSKKGNIMKINR